MQSIGIIEILHLVILTLHQALGTFRRRFKMQFKSPNIE